MFPYFFMLLLPLSMANICSRRLSANGRLGIWAFFILLLIFSGLRDGVGPDWSGYENIYDLYLNDRIWDFSNYAEPGFFLINKLSEAAGFGLYGVMFFCAFAFLWGVFSFALRTANPWMAIAVVVPYLVYVIAMSGIRQAAAIGFSFYMLSRWRDSSTLAKVSWILLAISFHNSAAIFLIFVIVSVRARLIVKVPVIFAVGLLLTYGLNETDSYAKYQSVYIQQNIESGGAYLHILLSALPAALYLWQRKKIIRAVELHPAIDLAAYMAIAAMFLVPFSSTGVDRLALHFSFLQMWVYPAIVRAFGANAPTLKVLVSVLVLSVFFGYFLLGTHAFAYLPYNNVIFNI